MGSWLRFASSRVYHRTGPQYIERGRSLCERFDLTRTGYELIGGDTTEPKDPRFKRCAHCVRVMSQRKPAGLD